MDERRRYYRIADNVILNYREVSAEVMAHGIEQLKTNRMGRAQLQSALLGMDVRLQELITQIGRAREDFAEVLDLMNKKVGLLERMINAWTGDRDTEPVIDSSPSDVSLSAGGLSFESSVPYETGAHLELEMVLLPSYQYIKAYGDVVSSGEHESRPGYHRIAVNFDWIREEDRDEIIQQVFRKQAEELRLQREGKGG